jgi:hypothetical protein
MALSGWRQFTVQAVAEKIGPVAELLVDDAFNELGVSEQDMTAAHYLRFIRLLYEKLPASIDRRELCRQAQAAVLQAYGFKKA